MPACRSAESTTLSADASAPVCEAAAFAPASLRPALTTAIGFIAAALASALMSLSDSMYISTASTEGSSTNCAATSTAVISASLPVVTAIPIGTPRSSPNESAPKPSAPDWLTSAILPAGIGVAVEENTGLKVANTRAGPPTAPMQLGPTSRMPCARATRTNSACAFAPSAPVSANPDVITMHTEVPTWAQSVTAASTAEAGTITRAKSTDRPISAILLKAGSPIT
ncbi:unannotated protein [freshwater metagenome]